MTTHWIHFIGAAICIVYGQAFAGPGDLYTQVGNCNPGCVVRTGFTKTPASGFDGAQLVALEL